jgi:hypothetical protein
MHNILMGMRQRCYDPNCSDYPNYGGRGITICPEWDDFTRFMTWALVNGYADDLTIERNDNNGNYEPSNCKWIPLPDQNLNTRRTRMVTAFGRTMPMVLWARDSQCKVPYTTLRRRLDTGWSAEKAIATPAM